MIYGYARVLTDAQVLTCQLAQLCQCTTQGGRLRKSVPREDHRHDRRLAAA